MTESLSDRLRTTADWLATIDHRREHAGHVETVREAADELDRLTAALRKAEQEREWALEYLICENGPESVYRYYLRAIHTEFPTREDAEQHILEHGRRDLHERRNRENAEAMRRQAEAMGIETEGTT